jgi:hypothetical protein
LRDARFRRVKARIPPDDIPPAPHGTNERSPERLRSLPRFTTLLSSHSETDWETERRRAMSEAETMLDRKTSELATAIDETRSELARLGEGQRTDAHRQLIARCKEAAEWLERFGKPAGDRPAEEAATLTQQAEQYLLDLRTKREAL